MGTRTGGSLLVPCNTAVDKHAQGEGFAVISATVLVHSCSYFPYLLVFVGLFFLHSEPPFPLGFSPQSSCAFYSFHQAVIPFAGLVMVFAEPGEKGAVC